MKNGLDDYTQLPLFLSLWPLFFFLFITLKDIHQNEANSQDQTKQKQFLLQGWLTRSLLKCNVIYSIELVISKQMVFCNVGSTVAPLSLPKSIGNPVVGSRS